MALNIQQNGGYQSVPQPSAADSSRSGSSRRSSLHDLIVCLSGTEGAPAQAGGRNVIYDFIKSVVLGGTDGLLSAVAIIAAAAGAGMSWQYTLVMGLAGVAAGSITYALGEFLSFKNQRDYILLAKRTKMFEFKHSKEHEQQKLMQSFIKRGVSVTDAETIVGKMAAYEPFFVSFLVAEELGAAIDDDDASLLSDGFVNVLSYASVGALPLLPLLLQPATQFSDKTLLTLSLALSLFLSAALGLMKNHFVFNTHWWYLGFEGFVVCVVCAAVAYSVGAGVLMLL